MTTTTNSVGIDFTEGARTVRADRGSALSCKSWQAEAAMRMLMNNLDPEVAEHPDALVVYGGRGRAARSWAAFDSIVETLKRLDINETLLVQSGKPVGVVRTHEDSPRVLIANSNIVPHWASQQQFDDYEAKGLMIYGQMTAGSWIYIGTQGILQGTYETFAESGRKDFGGTLKGKLCVTGGCGGMGGAQPLAVTLAEGTCLIADVDITRLQRRCDDNYLDEIVDGIDEAIDYAVELAKAGKAISVGVHANSVDLLERMLERNVIPDVLTDQTSAHDPLQGYVPVEYTFEEAASARASDPNGYQELSLASMVRHVRAMVELQNQGAVTFDYGNNIRQRALDNGFADAFAFPGFVPAYIREQFCVGRGPFRWVALSGDPIDIFKTDHALLKMFPADSGEYGERLHRWILGCHENPEALLAGDFEACKPRFGWQGLPSRICWFGLGERDKAGLKFNEMVASGEISAPVVIGRDHLDCGSVASPNRETEGMLDGSDAISDWALLNAMVNVASGASWVSLHHGGGVGIGFSQHAGQVVVADGTESSGKRIARVLSNDPMMGIFRHADAGYETATKCSADQNVDIPML